MIKGNKSLIALIIVWVGVLLVGGMYHKLEAQSKVINDVEISKKEKVLGSDGHFENVKFYLPNSNFTQLVEKIESIPVYFKTRDKVEVVAQKSFQNLFDSKLLKNPNIEINNIFIKGDTVYIDCDKEILGLKEQNKKNILGIYSLVNSITEIPGIKKVKILINGKEENGNFSRTYSRNMNF